MCEELDLQAREDKVVLIVCAHLHLVDCGLEAPRWQDGVDLIMDRTSGKCQVADLCPL